MADPTQAQAGEVQTGQDAAKTAQTDSLNSPGQEQKFDDSVSNASSPADVLRLIEEARSGAGAAKPKATEETSPAKEETQATETETAAETATDDTGAETTTEGETKPEGEGDGDTKGEEKSDEEDDGEGGKLPERVRLKNWQDHEKLAMQLKRANPKLSLAQAETLAKEALGIQDEKPAETKADDGQPKTFAEAQAKLEELETAEEQALADLDLGKVATLKKEQRALRKHSESLREQESKQKTAESTKFNTDFDASETKAKSLYEFVADPKSPGFARMSEIDEALKANDDPLYFSANKPLRIAQMVAAELAIAPKSPKARTATARPAVTTTAAKTARTVPPVASGTSRTSTSTTQGNDVDKAIGDLTNPEQVENFIARLTKR